MRIPAAISAPVAIAPEAILAFPYMNISNLGGDRAVSLSIWYRQSLQRAQTELL